MSLKQKLQAALHPVSHRQARKAEDFRARPCGEIDYDALVSDVNKRYPKILARLAE